MPKRPTTATSASALASAVATRVRTLGANPLRTVLSTLGIIIGVASLVAVLSVGDGMEADARGQISGTTDLQTMSVTPVLTRVENGISVPRSDVIAFEAADAAILSRRLDGTTVTLLQQGGAIVEQGHHLDRRDDRSHPSDSGGDVRAAIGGGTLFYRC